ncbi:MAG: hypothetical protein ACRDHB_02920 [Actinomycetota bacterium]
MRVRVGIGVLGALALALAPVGASAHEASKVNAQQRVFSKSQGLDRSQARVQLRITNKRFNEINRLVCETEISDRWLHPVTQEIRTYTEDWFLVIRNFPQRTRLRSKKDTIFVQHGELTTDPQWQPQGVTIKTTHCHVR